MRGRIRFVGSDGQPLMVRLAADALVDLPYQISAQGIFRAELEGTGETVAGYAVASPDAGSATPAGTAVFRFKSGSNVITEAGVGAVSATTIARIFVD